VSKKPLKKQTVSTLATALRYASRGLPVIPMHGTKDGACTCGIPACGQPGNHPRTENGVYDATVDPQFIEHLWRSRPKAKIGIVFGGPSEMLGLAIDGKAGRKNLRDLTRNHGKFPRTVTILDGDREIRLLRGDGAGPTNGELTEELWVLGDGDFILAPSSVETSTAVRRFKGGRRLGQVKIAQAPRWLFQIAAKNSSAVAAPPAPRPVQSPSVVLVPASDIEPERVGWIWPGVIASGRVTGLVGHPGLGKSQVAMDLAATVSTGRPWPGGVANENAGSVIILSAEDDPADTIVPRLIAAGADCAAVHMVKAVKERDGVERAFSLADDLDRLENEYDLRQARLLVVDPVSAYLGTTKSTGVNRNYGTDVRTVLGRLATFAADHDLGVLAIFHLNKTSGARAMMRIAGSLEWVAAPRAVFLVTEEAGTGRRLFLPLKNNLAPDRIGYAFEIESKVVADGIRTSAVVWSGDQITISADEALKAAAKKVTSGAVDFLQEVLSDGPVDQAEVVRQGKEAGYSAKSLRTARETLGVTPKKEGFGASGKWVWVPAGGAKVLKLVVDNDGNVPPGGRDAADGDGGHNAGQSNTSEAAVERPDDGGGS
jgi:putative DNA primase/helicase